MLALRKPLLKVNKLFDNVIIHLESRLFVVRVYKKLYYVIWNLTS